MKISTFTRLLFYNIILNTDHQSKKQKIAVQITVTIIINKKLIGYARALKGPLLPI